MGGVASFPGAHEYARWSVADVRAVVEYGLPLAGPDSSGDEDEAPFLGTLQAVDETGAGGAGDSNGDVDRDGVDRGAAARRAGSPTLQVSTHSAGERRLSTTSAGASSVGQRSGRAGARAGVGGRPFARCSWPPRGSPTARIGRARFYRTFFTYDAAPPFSLPWSPWFTVTEDSDEEERVEYGVDRVRRLSAVSLDSGGGEAAEDVDVWRVLLVLCVACGGTPEARASLLLSTWQTGRPPASKGGAAQPSAERGAAATGDGNAASAGKAAGHRKPGKPKAARSFNSLAAPTRGTVEHAPYSGDGLGYFEFKELLKTMLDLMEAVGIIDFVPAKGAFVRLLKSTFTECGTSLPSTKDPDVLASIGLGRRALLHWLKAQFSELTLVQAHRKQPIVPKQRAAKPKPETGAAKPRGRGKWAALRAAVVSGEAAQSALHGKPGSAGSGDRLSFMQLATLLPQIDQDNFAQSAQERLWELKKNALASGQAQREARREFPKYSKQEMAALARWFVETSETTGVVHRRKLVRLFSAIMPACPTEIFRMAIRRIDKNKDNCLSFHETIEALSQLLHSNLDKQLELVFDLFSRKRVSTKIEDGREDAHGAKAAKAKEKRRDAAPRRGRHSPKAAHAARHSRSPTERSRSESQATESEEARGAHLASKELTLSDLTAIVSQSASKFERILQGAIHAVNTLDKDGDGTVDIDEWTELMATNEGVLDIVASKAIVNNKLRLAILRLSIVHKGFCFNNVVNCWELGTFRELGGKLGRQVYGFKGLREVCKVLFKTSGRHNPDIDKLWFALEAVVPHGVVLLRHVICTIGATLAPDAKQLSVLVFRVADTDESGSLDTDEALALLLRAKAESNSEAAVLVQVADDLDTDGDGKISWAEFSAKAASNPVLRRVVDRMFGVSSTPILELTESASKPRKRRPKAPPAPLSSPKGVGSIATAQAAKARAAGPATPHSVAPSVGTSVTGSVDDARDAKPEPRRRPQRLEQLRAGDGDGRGTPSVTLTPKTQKKLLTRADTATFFGLSRPQSPVDTSAARRAAAAGASGARDASALPRSVSLAQMQAPGAQAAARGPAPSSTVAAADSGIAERREGASQGLKRSATLPVMPRQMGAPSPVRTAARPAFITSTSDAADGTSVTTVTGTLAMRALPGLSEEHEHRDGDYHDDGGEAHDDRYAHHVHVSLPQAPSYGVEAAASAAFNDVPEHARVPPPPEPFDDAEPRGPPGSKQELLRMLRKTRHDGAVRRWEAQARSSSAHGGMKLVLDHPESVVADSSAFLGGGGASYGFTSFASSLLTSQPSLTMRTSMVSSLPPLGPDYEFGHKSRKGLVEEQERAAQRAAEALTMSAGMQGEFPPAWTETKYRRLRRVARV